ncbi:hypothetical protein JHD50_10725 [Sulfurimonas sp. MAG313]|nr:hypothetical protein [Sulfurimonas sp. MAG313]MDF1881766.1 hypothetical protein [Sulfurimonas sp. MAG313]
MTKDELQFWMLIAFAVAFLLSSYKIYSIFSAPAEGKSTQSQHLELQDIIIDFFKNLEKNDYDEKELFEQLSHLDILQNDAYKNFNLNRFYQILQGLYLDNEVSSLPSLISKLKNEQ